MHGYLALRSLTIAGPDGTPIPSQSEDQMSTLMRLILEGDYKDEWTAADTMRDDNYGFESYSFWPQPGQDSDMCCIDDRDQRTALEGVLADLSEEQKEKEFMIDLGILMADTTDIMEHYRALKNNIEDRPPAQGQPPARATHHGCHPRQQVHGLPLPHCAVRILLRLYQTLRDVETKEDYGPFAPRTSWRQDEDPARHRDRVARLQQVWPHGQQRVGPIAPMPEINSGKKLDPRCGHLHVPDSFFQATIAS